MTADRWALVDVETSGLSSRQHRVLSLAVLAMDGDTIVDEYDSLFNPGCDPGPVHIHRLTRKRLRGAPTFDASHPRLSHMLQGRTLVAHNASFDHGFLSSEMRRLKAPLPVTHRLCTVTLARRLQLDVPNVKLTTLAAYWGVRQGVAHDARDDVRTLAGVFRNSVAMARDLGLELPLAACAPGARAHPVPVTRVPCVWRNPGKYTAQEGLVQGTKIVITGETVTPRDGLARRLVEAGMDVMDAASGRTGLVVCNHPGRATNKLKAAALHGIVVIDELTVMRLLDRVVPGTAIIGPAAIFTPDAVPPVVLPTPPPAPVGAFAGRRVLVVGGNHLEATLMRSRLVQLGATPAINLTAGVSDVLILDGGAGDPRIPKMRERGLSELSMTDVDTALGLDPEEAPAPVLRREWIAPVLEPGAVIDIPASINAFAVNVAWRTGAAANVEVDVVAFEVDGRGIVLSDDEFVFYNQPSSPDGAVSVSIDGDCEQGIHIDLAALDDDVHRVVIGAAIAGGATFGELGALSVTADTADASVASAVLDAATTERSMIIAEVYRRAGKWRLRALGQGYDDDLAGFAQRYGVDVDGA